MQHSTKIRRNSKKTVEMLPLVDAFLNKEIELEVTLSNISILLEKTRGIVKTASQLYVDDLLGGGVVLSTT